MKNHSHRHLIMSWISGFFLLISILGGAISCGTAGGKGQPADLKPAEVVRMHLMAIRADDAASANRFWADPPEAARDKSRPCTEQARKFLGKNTDWRIMATFYEKDGSARVIARFDEPDMETLIADIVKRGMPKASLMKGPASIEDKLCEIIASELSLAHGRDAPPLPRKTSIRDFHLEKIENHWLIVRRVEREGND